MFCYNCGKELSDEAVICVHCGAPTKNFSAKNAVGVAPYTEIKRNGLGIAGFTVGLASMYFGAYLCIVSIVGLILSLAAVANRKKYTSGNGLAVAGLILSVISLIFWLFTWVLILTLIFTAPTMR